jgi:hypothetical protein
MNTKAEVQEKRLSRHESSLTDSRDSSLLELGEQELLIVIGGRAATKKPKVTIEVKPDGTIVVTQH